MLAEKKYRPQPLDLVLPPHSPGKAPPNREAGAHSYHQKQYSSSAATPPYHAQYIQSPAGAYQPQQGAPTHAHHHHHHYQPQQSTPSAQPQSPPQQQHQQPHPRTVAPNANQSTRRGSADRGNSKEPSTRLKASTTPKLSHDHVGPYLLGKTLGKGSSGCVKLARHRKTNEQVAIKIISKASLVNRAAVHRGIEREIAIMKLINHPHVIRLYDVYETEKELFLVMEYVSGGELFEYLVNKGRLEEAEALRFFQQIIVGLAFCHKRKICHRDLKPENLLLDERMNVKIADFGMASLQKTGRLLETSCGSPHYASPEVVTGMKYDGSSSDIWSCGIILYALLTGHLPFDDENIRQLLSKVKAGKFYMPTDISAGARDLISRMLTVNPKRRITMQGVMMHPWFRMVNPERNTLGEPAQDPDSSRPMQAEELDAEILRHMRWLFAPGPSHSDPDSKEVYDEEALLQEIQEKMTNNEENMEKLFYHLLYQHKNEVLENYAGDECDSVLDGPRRRADSFPNSAPCSIRSATPDLCKGGSYTAARSLRESPITTPSSPLTMTTTPTSAAAAASAAIGGARNIQAEPTPFHLNEMEPKSSPTSKSTPDSAVSTTETEPHASIKKKANVEGSWEKAEGDERSTTPISNKDPAAVIPVIEHRSQMTSQLAPPPVVDGSHAGAADLVKDTGLSTTKAGKETIIPTQEATNAHGLSQPSHSSASGYASQVVAPTPISPNRKMPFIRDNVQKTAGREESEASNAATPAAVPPEHEPIVLTSVGATSSIESQVLATQISEATANSLVTMATARTSITTGTTGTTGTGKDSSSSKSSSSKVADGAPAATMVHKDSSLADKAVPGIDAPTKTHTMSNGGAGASVSTLASDIVPEKAKTLPTKVKPQRPILHPLDVKASAGMTAMTVSASQHSRKYSDGSPSLPGTSLSPTGPKRPWFARLFDFKPQPLMFRSNLTALETQGRLENILREMFGSQIQIENLKRPSNGFKCKYEGGVIDGQQAKAVKFKIEIQEKTRSILNSSTSSMATGAGSYSGSGSSVNSHHSSSSPSAVATMLAATVEMQGRYAQNQQQHSHHQSSSLSDAGNTLTAFRRASDGGSILLAAAAAAAATMNSVRNSYHQHYHQHHYQQPKQQLQQKQQHHRHSVDGSAVLSSSSAMTAGSSIAVSPQIALSKRTVKVTLHQQQGANSTLRMIYERLCFVWDQQDLMYHKHRPSLAPPPPPPPPSGGAGSGGESSGSASAATGQFKSSTYNPGSYTTEKAMTTTTTTNCSSPMTTSLVVTKHVVVDMDRDHSFGTHQRDDGLSGSKLYLAENSPVPTIAAKAPRGAAI